jgi:16S rRNA U516 pseudouridylate synthase RsuA-like enzyme
METKRLNKAISETGYCSRRAADKLIEDGHVKVNGESVGLGVKVTKSDRITGYKTQRQHHQLPQLSRTNLSYWSFGQTQ